LYALASHYGEKAIEIDGELSPAYAALAGVKVFSEFDYPEAERLYEKAIALDPSNSTARQWYAEFLSYRGRHEEALSESDKALAIDPLSTVVKRSKLINLYRARHYDEAIAESRTARELDIELGFGVESLCFRAMGRYSDHVAAFQRTISRDEKGRRLADEAGEVFERSGINGFYRWQIEHIDEYSESSVPYPKVQLYALLGERDRAIEWMQKVIEMRAEQAQWWITDPALDSVRDDPAFRAVIRNAGLG
jgi:tetratricopeptide (TPR) repeat protein